LSRQRVTYYRELFSFSACRAGGSPEGSYGEHPEHHPPQDQQRQRSRPWSWGVR